MQWYTCVAYFFGGAFLVNAIPHFAKGLSGHRFPTPFASPPAKGQSPPMVNVLWGALDVAIGYVLVRYAREFQLRQICEVLALGAGGQLAGVVLARASEHVHGGP